MPAGNGKRYRQEQIKGNTPMTDNSNTDSDQNSPDSGHDFERHQTEINEFVNSKIQELGLHQTVRLLGHCITSKTSLYRAEHVEDGNPELLTFIAQDHASSMVYWTEAELGIQDISGGLSGYRGQSDADPAGGDTDE